MHSLFYSHTQQSWALYDPRGKQVATEENTDIDAVMNFANHLDNTYINCLEVCDEWIEKRSEKSKELWPANPDDIVTI